jgi:hypothetical protein
VKNENTALNQNLTQPSSGDTPVNSSNTLPESLTSSFTLPLNNSSQLASVNPLNYSSAESEWGTNDNRAFADRTEIDRFAASSDNKAASSLDISSANRNNQALEPVNSEGNTTSSTASTDTPVGDNTQFANGVGQLGSTSPGSPGIDIDGQYLYGTENAQSSVWDANVANPSALYQNSSTPPTFGPIVPDNQEGEISTDQSAPYGTSNNLAVSQGTSAIDTYSTGSTSELPLSFSQPSLLPSEAFAPAAPDNVPPETVLPLVIDSNTGSPIQNGGATDSNSILSITFEGLDETGTAVAGFQCSIDGSPSYYCTTPAVVDNNRLGSVSTLGFNSIQPNVVHTFQVSAVDAAGNLDPTPASFEWNIVNSIPSDTTALNSNAPDTTPPDTQIVSAVDSNNAEVSNGSSLSVSQSSSALPVGDQATAQGSAANTITFSFAGTDDSNIVAGYECATYSSSDLSEQVVFAPCSSPILSQIMEDATTISAQAGTDDTRTFQVRATDAAGNVDPSPATFQWNDNPTIATQEEPVETGFETLTDQDPLLQQQQQQLPQDPLLQQQQQQLPQDPLLQQQQQLPQDPLLQQQQQQLPQDPLLQHPGITLHGSFPAEGQSGLISQQGFIQELTGSNTEHVTEGQNTLSSPSVLQTPIQNTPSLPSGTTIYGSSETGIAGILGAD